MIGSRREDPSSFEELLDYWCTAIISDAVVTCPLGDTGTVEDMLAFGIDGCPAQNIMKIVFQSNGIYI